jgi:type II secretory pathway pseudopilin PulG
LNKKLNKGISLVELTVAMGILSMVFAGTVTLIIMVVNLSFNSGLKTVAIALAQKGLTDKITEFRTSPNINCVTINTGLPAGVSSLTKCTTANPPVPKAGVNDFVLVTSTVAWRPKGDPNISTYQMSQIIRKSYQ